MDWNVFLAKAGALLLSLSILVVLHELGHFIPAKIFKTRVEKFYLFFNPWFSLFKKKIGETTYGIGWLPLGGYVKISGMMDESMDTDQLDKEPQPWEFRSKPAWQRLIIMIGGVSVNLILAMFIYAMLLMAFGEEFLPMKNASNGIWIQDPVALEIGLQNGDKILSLDGKELESFSSFEGELILNEAKSIQIERAGVEQNIPIPEGFIRNLISSKQGSQGMLLAPRLPTVIGELSKGDEAEKKGFLPGDQLIGIAGVETPFFDQFKTVITENKSKNDVEVVLLRDGQRMTKQVNVSENGTLGFRPDMELSNYFDTEVNKYGFFAAFPAGVMKALDMLGKYVKQFKLIFFSKEVKAKDSLGGFYSIGNIFPYPWNWISFWELTAFLSIILAFMNILPIPALDGGHVMFLIYEIIVGKAPNEKFLQYAQMIGMLLLLALMLYVNGLDILRATGLGK